MVVCRSRESFEHGADIIVYSATKAIGGHGRTIAGAVLESADDLIEDLDNAFKAVFGSAEKTAQT